MEPVKVTALEGHSIITGSDRWAVEQKIAEIVARGGRMLETVRALGNNWIATVEEPRTTPNDWCEVTNIGYQMVIEGSSEAIVRVRIEQLTTYGAVLIAGPEAVEGKWVAVVDEKGRR
jgi:hypothetical protein